MDKWTNEQRNKWIYLVQGPPEARAVGGNARCGCRKATWTRRRFPGNTVQEVRPPSPGRMMLGAQVEAGGVGSASGRPQRRSHDAVVATGGSVAVVDRLHDAAAVPARLDPSVAVRRHPHSRLLRDATGPRERSLGGLGVGMAGTGRVDIPVVAAGRLGARRTAAAARRHCGAGVARVRALCGRGLRRDAARVARGRLPCRAVRLRLARRSHTRSRAVGRRRRTAPRRGDGRSRHRRAQSGRAHRGLLSALWDARPRTSGGNVGRGGTGHDPRLARRPVSRRHDGVSQHDVRPARGTQYHAAQLCGGRLVSLHLLFAAAGRRRSIAAEKRVGVLRPDA